jgi:hypothetical protein
VSNDEALDPTSECVPSAVRHALRNKLAAMRNSVFYIHRALSNMGVLDHDPRVPRFLDLIEAEIRAVDLLLDPPTDSSSPESRTEVRSDSG